MDFALLGSKSDITINLTRVHLDKPLQPAPRLFPPASD